MRSVWCVCILRSVCVGGSNVQQPRPNEFTTTAVPPPIGTARLYRSLPFPWTCGTHFGAPAALFVRCLGFTLKRRCTVRKVLGFYVARSVTKRSCDHCGHGLTLEKVKSTRISNSLSRLLTSPTLASKSEPTLLLLAPAHRPRQMDHTTISWVTM